MKTTTVQDNLERAFAHVTSVLQRTSGASTHRPLVEVATSLRQVKNDVAAASVDIDAVDERLRDIDLLIKGVAPVLRSEIALNSISVAEACVGRARAALKEDE